MFEVYAPREYVTAGSWAGMGVGLLAAIGTKLAPLGRDVVTLTGDGGPMMSITELHTALQHGLTISVVVFDNADYRISTSHQRSRSTGLSPIPVGLSRLRLPCRRVWVGGTTVCTRGELREALVDALDADRPMLLDVKITDKPSVVNVADFDSSLSFD